ncbi:MAG: glycosyltransferase family 4 protein, partial [bacterium]|nr:glycosyltransferase family 4 protein [bacterium]
FTTARETYKLALRQKADIYHFHDPELIPVGILLKVLTRAKVIYDVHEDVPKQILTKEWIPLYLRALVSKIAFLSERVSSIFFDAIIVAGNDIAKHFPTSNKITILRNFPLLEATQGNKKKGQNAKGPFVIVYTGGLTKDRGIKEMVEMINYVKNGVELWLLGSFDDFSLEREIKKKASKKVKFVGQVPYEQVFQYLGEADIGLILLHPTPHYVVALDRINKIFEYMAAGLPIVASNFPGLREIIEDIGCGITVNPLNPREIAETIEYLIMHPNNAQKMGENGRKATLKKYNWEIEKERLLTTYKKLTKKV